MNFQIEELGATKKKLSVEVPAETVQKEMSRAVKAITRQASIKGFRPGKVPASIVKKLYAPQIEQEVIQKLVNDALPEALEQYKDNMASQPMLEDSDLKEGEAFQFSVSFDVMPEFEVSGYEGLELTREKVLVFDAAIDKKLEDLRNAYSTTRSIEDDRPVAAGDLAVIDYKGYVDGKELEGGSNSNYQLEIGAGFFNEDLENGLVGMKKGDEKDITVTFPEDHYNPKLKGQTVRFDVKLIDIKEKVVPELNDEFVKDLGQQLETVQALRDKLHEDMTAAETRRVENALQQQAREKLLELVEFEAPEGLVLNELENMMSSTSFNLRRSGLSLEAMGLSEAKLREDYKPEAEKRVKTALILEKIAKEKGIEVTGEDIDGQIMTIARETGQPPESIKEIYLKNNMMASMEEGLLADKSLKYVIDNAKIEVVEPVVELEDEAEKED